ncbi:protein kinase domain-containing protein [Archangium lansingense]|uniref:Protein kinase n=1 Tax=Archangium lansingense TaxID=2995310 RepID=A0ABT4A6H8_9BACT|nr:protein kinase [Archangium lansinium]MCY1077258.1 protein kinase [Archangium lansinium]
MLPPGELVPEENEDFEDSFLSEVARVEAPLRVPLPGTRMGGREGNRFEILEELGGGAMGQVFRARDCELAREVALKFLLPRSARGGQLPGSPLWEEARAIARLDHENIVRLFDVAEWGGAPWEPWVPFLVMELLEGESLASLLRRERPGLRRALEILGAVASGLAHAHAHHIVHRDLKPSNVLITREGRVKLLDFGLAHLMSGESPLVPHLPTAGTPAYMAPEQWRGEGQDARTDLWAAGVMLYELLTGELPYPFISLQELRERVTSPEPVPSVLERVPELPGEVERLVAELLAKVPGRRLGSASELRERLSRLEEALGPWRETPALVAPQRRQVTLVSCGLVVSSDGRERLDPEDLSELQAAFQRWCAEVFQRYDGAIALSVGDEVLACFGYPTAREDDSERAVRAGLHLTRERPTQGPWLSHPGLAVAVGIHTDAVVFDALASEGLGRMPTLQGEAPGVAAALARSAGPGGVVLSGTTWKLVRGAFETEPPGTHPAEVYRVVRERRAVSRFERTLVAGGLTPLVGREHELERLMGLWERARRGQWACVLLSGEAGIGKSRLIQELRERVAPESSHLLLGQCWEPFRNSAFHPVFELLRRFFRLGPEGLSQPGARAVDARLEGLGVPPEHGRQIAALLASPDATAPSALLAALEHQKERKRKVLEALKLLFLRMAEERPVLLVIEDLHWADPSTLELLGLLGGDVATAGLLLALTARPGFQPAWPLRPGFHPLVLDRLTAESAAALVREAARGTSLPEETIQQLVAKTDGIPLFVEEMTRMVLERSFTGNLSTIPVTLHELLLARLDALPPRQKTLAQLCAVIGRDFIRPLLVRLLARVEATLREDLLGLVSAGLLQRKGEEPGADEYQFRHALIQEAAYQSLPRGLRRQHHRRVAQALVEGFPDVVETRPEVLAHHYTEAGEYALAMHHWELAAKLALLRSASLEACSHLKQALTLVPSFPEGAKRVEDEMRLLSGLGVLLMSTQGYGSPEVARTYERALELLPLAGEALPELNLLCMGLGAYFIEGARFEKAYELAGQLLALGRQWRHPRLVAQGYRMLASLCFYEGALDRALEYGEQALRLVDPHPDGSLVIIDDMSADEWVDDLAIPCFAHLVQARPGVSQRFSHKLIEVVRGPGPTTRGTALVYLSAACQLRGEVPCTLEWAEEGAAVATGRLFQHLLAFAKGLQGWALCRLGRTREGLEAMRAGIGMMRELGARVLMPYYLYLLSDVSLLLGQVEEGLAKVREALRLVEETRARLFESELYRLQGELLRVAGNEEDARHSLLRAAAVAHRQRAHLFELRALVALARQLRDTGHPEAARRRLERLCGRFAPDLDVPELQEARALLTPLRPTPGSPPHPPRESPPGVAR